MKTIIITAIAATLFSASVSATDVYRGIEDGNTDLSTRYASASGFVGVQPGVGDSFDVYGGIGDGNADLFKADRSDPMDSGSDPDIYMNVSGNPDLSF